MSTVLVVDADESIGLLLEMMLRRAHFHVITASTGSQAVELAQSVQPDVIVVDERVSEIPIADVCLHLKKDPRTRHIPIMLSTDVISQNLPAHARHIGADGVLGKPFRGDDVLVALKELLPH